MIHACRHCQRAKRHRERERENWNGRERKEPSYLRESSGTAQTENNWVMFSFIWRCSSRRNGRKRIRRRGDGIRRRARGRQREDGRHERRGHVIVLGMISNKDFTAAHDVCRNLNNKIPTMAPQRANPMAQFPAATVRPGRGEGVKVASL